MNKQQLVWTSILVIVGVAAYFLIWRYLLSSWTGYVAGIALFSLLVLVHARVAGRKLSTYGWNGKVSLSWIALGLSLLFVVGLAGRLAFPGFDKVLYGDVALFSGAFLFLMVLAVVFEELVFRGFFQTLLEPHVRPGVLALILSAAFAAIHLTWIPVLGAGYALAMAGSAFLAGLVLFLIFYRTHQLLTLILLHFLVNVLNLVQIWLEFHSSLEWAFWLLWGLGSALVLLSPRLRRNLFKVGD